MFHTQPKTYTQVPFVLYQYFALRCQSNGYVPTEWVGDENEQPVDCQRAHSFSSEYISHRTVKVDVWSQRCDDIMQKILGEAYGA